MRTHARTLDNNKCILVDAAQPNTIQHQRISSPPPSPPPSLLLLLLLSSLHFIVWLCALFFSCLLRWLVCFFWRANVAIAIGGGGGDGVIWCAMLKQPLLIILMPNCYPTNMIYIYLLTLSFCCMFNTQTYTCTRIFATIFMHFAGTDFPEMFPSYRSHLILKHVHLSTKCVCVCAFVLLKIIGKNKHKIVGTSAHAKKAIKCIAQKNRTNGMNKNYIR